MIRPRQVTPVEVVPFLQRHYPAAMTVQVVAMELELTEAATSALLAQMAREGKLTRHVQRVPEEVSGSRNRLVYRYAETTAPFALHDGSEVNWLQPWPPATIAQFSQALNTFMEQLRTGETLNSHHLKQAAWAVCLDLGALDTDLELNAAEHLIRSDGQGAQETLGERLAALCQQAADTLGNATRDSVVSLYAAGILAS